MTQKSTSYIEEHFSRDVFSDIDRLKELLEDDYVEMPSACLTESQFRDWLSDDAQFI